MKRSVTTNSSAVGGDIPDWVNSEHLPFPQRSPRPGGSHVTPTDAFPKSHLKNQNLENPWHNEVNETLTTPTAPLMIAVLRRAAITCRPACPDFLFLRMPAYPTVHGAHRPVHSRVRRYSTDSAWLSTDRPSSSQKLVGRAKSFRSLRIPSNHPGDMRPCPVRRRASPSECGFDDSEITLATISHAWSLDSEGRPTGTPLADPVIGRRNRQTHLGDAFLL